MKTIDLDTKFLNFCEFQLQDSPSEEKAPRIDAIYDFLTDHLGKSSKSEIKESDLTSHLNDIIAGSSNENPDDKELVGTIINMIDAYSIN